MIYTAILDHHPATEVFSELIGRLTECGRVMGVALTLRSDAKWDCKVEIDETITERRSVERFNEDGSRRLLFHVDPEPIAFAPFIERYGLVVKEDK